MPITQDRLIRLIDIAGECLAWADTMEKIASGANFQSLRDQTLDLKSRENLSPPVAKLIDNLLAALETVNAMLRRSPISHRRREEYAAEKEHFRLRRKTNEVARNYIRARRGQAIDLNNLNGIGVEKPIKQARPKEEMDPERDARIMREFLAKEAEGQFKPNETKPKAGTETEDETAKLKALIQPKAGVDKNGNEYIFDPNFVPDGDLL
jgi:hypothetical protein